jgi:hypothetical protein
MSEHDRAAEVKGGSCLGPGPVLEPVSGSLSKDGPAAATGVTHAAPKSWFAPGEKWDRRIDLIYHTSLVLVGILILAMGLLILAPTSQHLGTGLSASGGLVLLWFGWVVLKWRKFTG